MFANFVNILGFYEGVFLAMFEPEDLLIYTVYEEVFNKTV